MTSEGVLPGPDTPESPRAAGVWLTLPWALAVLALLPLAWWLGRFGPVPSADDWGQYMLHAQALVDGRPFSDIPYIFSPYAWGSGPPVSAPGLPLLLVPIVASVGFAPWMHAAINLLALAGIMGATAAYFGRYDSARGAWTALLAGTAFVTVGATRTVNPDLLFTGALWVAFTLVDGAERWSAGRTALIGVLAVLAILLRGASLPLVPAFFVFGLLAWKSVGPRALLIGVVTGAVAYLVYSVMGAARMPAVPEYVEIPPPTPSEGTLQTLARTLFRYRLPVFQAQLYPFPSATVNDGYHVLATGVVAVGVGRWLLGNWYRIAAIWAGGYAAFLFLVGLSAGRYLWPLWPLLAYGLVWGLELAWTWTRNRARSRVRWAARADRVVPVILSGLVVMAIVTYARSGPEPSLLSRPEVQDVAAYLSAESPTPRVSFMKARSFAYATGLPTMPLTDPPSQRAALEELDVQAITHLVVGGLGQTDPEALSAFWTNVIQEAPERFEQVHSNAEFRIYRVRATPE